ncbi:MAG: hypothetical protein R2873_30515 [Caldilineaceae bacterium]
MSVNHSFALLIPFLGFPFSCIGGTVIIEQGIFSVCLGHLQIDGHTLALALHGSRLLPWCAHSSIQNWRVLSSPMIRRDSERERYWEVKNLALVRR